MERKNCPKFHFINEWRKATKNRWSKAGMNLMIVKMIHPKEVIHLLSFCNTKKEKKKHVKIIGKVTTAKWPQIGPLFIVFPGLNWKGDVHERHVPGVWNVRSRLIRSYYFLILHSVDSGDRRAYRPVIKSYKNKMKESYY